MSPRPTIISLDSQPGFTGKSLSPALVVVISDCFTPQAGWPRAKHWWGLTLACTTPETPEPAHPVDSYRPYQSTITKPPPQVTHSRDRLRGHQSPAEVKSCSVEWAPVQLILHSGQSLVVRGHSQSLQLISLGKPSHWPTNSNQNSTRGGCTQPTWRAHLKYPAWVIGEAVPLDSTGHLLH